MPGAIPILIGWNLIALPIVAWLFIFKRDPTRATRTFRRTY